MERGKGVRLLVFDASAVSQLCLSAIFRKKNKKAQFPLLLHPFRLTLQGISDVFIELFVKI